MNRIIEGRKQMYTDIFSGSGDHNWNYSINKSTEDIQKEISMILPKDRDQWITEGSSNSDFFFKKVKSRIREKRPSPKKLEAKQRNADSPPKKVFNLTNVSNRAKTSVEHRKNSASLPIVRKRPKSLPKILISGGFTISQQTLLEIRELFFFYSAGQEFITLDCKEC